MRRVSHSAPLTRDLTCLGEEKKGVGQIFRQMARKTNQTTPNQALQQTAGALTPAVSHCGAWTAARSRGRWSPSP